MEVIGLYLSYRHVGKSMIIYYTEISNFLALLASLFYLFKTDAGLFRYISTCMLMMTFLVSLFVLSPSGGLKLTMLHGECLYHHTLVPILSLLSYLFFEEHSSLWYLPVLITLFYGLIMIVLNLKGKIEGPYDFLKIRKNGVKATALWVIVLIVIMSLICKGIVWISMKTGG